MINKITGLGVAAFAVLLVTGCESDGISTRIHEKSATYATLHVWQKRFIEKGVIATGFTPDMVYMAVGNPSQVEKSAAPGLEVWTYRNYYPAADARTMDFNLNGEQPYQPHNVRTFGPKLGPGGQMPAGMDAPPTSANGRSPESIATTSGTPQGGSMEIADLESFRLTVIFQNGKVAQFSVVPNR